MTVVLEKKMAETDTISGFLEYIDSFDPELFSIQQFQSQPGSDSYTVEVRLSTLKKIADQIRLMKAELTTGENFDQWSERVCTPLK